MKYYHNYHFQGELEITGIVTLGGPQDEKDIPKPIREIFENYPDIQVITLQYKNQHTTGADMYQRMKE